MVTSTLPAGAQLSGTVILYVQPEPLSLELHGNLGMNRVDKPWGFAAQTHFVPLTVTEFAPASLSYPIIFAGSDRQPIAVMGINEGTNLFVSADGAIRPEAYLPAYIRRYPFVLANDEAQQRMVVCIDRSAKAMGENADVPFFENGEPSDYLKQCMEFCQNFDVERARTESFVQLIKDLDLFESRKAFYTPPAFSDAPPPEQVLIAEYFAVSEEKLNALPIEKLKELRDNGALAQIYAHLISLLGWDKLIAIALTQQAQPVQTVGNA